jgi:hypothetical protein
LSIPRLAVRLSYEKELTMKYLLMIYENEKRNEKGYDKKEHAEYDALNEAHNSVILGGNALKPTQAATSVRVRDGKRLTTDGPFAETKEQLGGYYLLDVKNLDDAIVIAGKIPAARYGCIEIRPILEM